MSKTLLIVFVKNAVLGKVKTRLAKTIGNEKAFEVYQQLLTLTENGVKEVEADQHIYFSDKVDSSQWGKALKFVQKGKSLGDRMFNAFKDGFELGYDKVVLIGSDLPDISAEIIHQGFLELERKEVVFGPAADGGYYLIGIKQAFGFIFENKPWSESDLLHTTLDELGKQEISYSLLQTLNDIDTFEDLKSSKLYTNA